ncbi:hypothetical protein BJ741DRAFT_583100 [Chytriomyces cf. hyalinus JEL632]|nr:hypothetical protein BJ741DRAFT_583100 [Chytriomyces cf. hyalinus JEL632]
MAPTVHLLHLVLFIIGARLALAVPISSNEFSGGRNVPAGAQGSFFSVTPTNEPGVSCQGSKGKLSLYAGAVFTVTWNPLYFEGIKASPKLLSLFLTVWRVSSSTTLASQGPNPISLVKTVPISAATFSQQCSLPSDLKLSDPATLYALQGEFVDTATNNTISFPSNTTNVVLLEQGAACDLEAASRAPVDVPMAAGLGGGAAVAFIVAVSVAGYRSRKLRIRTQKGKDWIDGPRSMNNRKEHGIDAVLQMANNAFWPRKKVDDDASSLSSANSSAANTTTSSAPTECVPSNPFMSSDEEGRSGTSAPASPKSNHYKERESKEFLVSLAHKSTSSSLKERILGSTAISKPRDVHTLLPSQQLANRTDNLQKTTVQDPKTGQMRTFVFLDSRGPPGRNVGGSSSWAPPTEALSQRHRVLVSFTATSDDELSVERGDMVMVERILEDNWCLITRLENPSARKPEAVNKGKAPEMLPFTALSANASASSSMAAKEPADTRVNWGSRFAFGWKENNECLGDVGSKGKRGFVPYNILLLCPQGSGIPVVTSTNYTLK